ncbi:hypothetical protein K488DRAFT_85928 [Vararia minispora EC-137]|uniref:Uncharacterized protein n=1 Tax=Vararia minispora EC-137 TaxID=1314806 RepID=A0ACB8QL55_9AGAM|nr:hypothetical protein K488DRAFT_85928 [Vararia minispora EC-137]
MKHMCFLCDPRTSIVVGEPRGDLPIVSKLVRALPQETLDSGVPHKHLRPYTPFLAFKSSQPTSSLTISFIMASFNIPSANIVQTEVPSGTLPRDFYLQRYNSAAPPYLSYSSFVPRSIVEHLMRDKKDRAISVKFQKGRNDSITNMEGAMHTFLTPVVPVFLHGDYQYVHGHRMYPLPDYKDTQTARIVVLSALVQPDFQDAQVMVQLSRLGQKEFVGAPLPDGFRPISIQAKQNSEDRLTYDIGLKQHLVTHLTALRCLPPLSAVSPISVTDAEALLTSMICTDTIRRVNAFVRIDSGAVLSLELLFRAALEQTRNEFRALERLCIRGYVYTFDPPAIFARKISAALLNRLMIGALHALARETTLARLRVYGFNDYDDPAALPLVRRALAPQPVVAVMSKATLLGPNGTYAPPEGCRDALLVIHNNSDAFGQNIETEQPGGSLDGTIGAYSSAAASLHLYSDSQMIVYCQGLTAIIR